MIIYVGDTGNVVRRITGNHCSGNVEASKLRESIAEAIGYGIKKTRRASGKTRKRIDLPKPIFGERAVSAYVASGHWQFVRCDSKEEANDFQWFVIATLKPALNRESRPWKEALLDRFEILLVQLQKENPCPKAQISSSASWPGVYVFHHQHLPPHA